MAHIESGATADATESNRTREIADWIASVRSEDIGPAARIWAQDALLDWFAVTLPGSREPLSRILAETVQEEGTGPARLVGGTASVSPLNAAMTNGAASHALDYDDMNSIMMGHPSVPLVPALLALADMRKVSGRELVEAFIVGYEAELLAARSIGLAHYDRGWHMTATVGTIGAAAASAYILGLTAEQTAHALGLAVAQAAGLKSMFGTMSKPFQVGKASANGLLSARLAQKGMTSRTDAIECSQGLADTQSDGIYPVEFVRGSNGRYAVEGNLFKFHAACYLTHSAIESAQQLAAKEAVTPDTVERVVIEVDKTALKVCNIPTPETGLQVKFSLRHTVAMGLSGIDTSNMDSYSDATAQDEGLRTLDQKTMVVGIDSDSRTGARVRIDTKDGRSLEAQRDVGIPSTDQPEQRQKLLKKFSALAVPVLGEAACATLTETIFSVGDLEDASVLTKLSQPH